MSLQDDGLLHKKSRLRQEVEALLEQKGLVLESRISVMNLDNGEVHHFEDYQEALKFLKGKKGRWYMTTPGIRRLREERQ